MADQSGKKSGVRIYVVTVDAETFAVLKTEEEDPNSGKRTEVPPETIALAHDQTPRHVAADGSAWLPAGFQASTVIVVGTPAAGGAGDTAAGAVRALAAPGPPHPPISPRPVEPVAPRPTPPKPTPTPKPMPVPVHHNGEPNTTPPPKKKGSKPMRARTSPPKL